MDVFQGWVLRRRDGALCVPADLGMMWLGADYVGDQGLLHPTGPGLVSHGYSKDGVKGDASCQFSFRANSLAPRNRASHSGGGTTYGTQVSINCGETFQRWLPRDLRGYKMKGMLVRLAENREGSCGMVTWDGLHRAGRSG